MELLKTYSISTDITNGKLNHNKLESEVRTSGFITNFLDISSNSEEIKIYGDSLSDEASLDALVLAHKSQNLDEYKQSRYNEVDGKTMGLIAAGFPYDGETFSLSLAAQKNWDAIKTSKSDFTFPLQIGTIDNNTYSLATENVNVFWVTARDTIMTHLDSGRALKKLIFDAVDEAAVDAIIDNR